MRKQKSTITSIKKPLPKPSIAIQGVPEQRNQAQTIDLSKVGGWVGNAIKCETSEVNSEIMGLEEGVLALGTKVREEEQRRTTLKKNLFIQYFPNCRFIISETCKKAGVDPATFYRWIQQDKDFAQRLKDIKVEIDGAVVDMLMYKIFAQADGASIRYYLNRMHKDYIRCTPDNPNHKTLEDFLDELDQEDEESDSSDIKVLIT